MKRILETALLLMGTLGFWGFVYPELCVTGDITQSSGSASPGEDTMTEECEDVYEILNGEGKIRIKFRMTEYLYQVKEKTDSKKDNSND